MRPMITNGGAHPADKWADMTVDTIMDLIQVADDADTPEAASARAAKRDLRPILFNIFNDHHDGVQRLERSACSAVKGAKAVADHLAKKIDVTEHMSVTDAVDAALAATPFVGHFGKPEVKEVIHLIIAQHTANVMHIERRYHADRHEAKGV